jgi:hypothetical protein
VKKLGEIKTLHQKEMKETKKRKRMKKKGGKRKREQCRWCERN